MENKKMLERLRAYEEYVIKMRKEKEKQEEENSHSVLRILHAHERNIGTGGGCLL